MPWNLFSRNNRVVSDSYTTGSSDKKKVIVLIVVLGILIMGVPMLVTLLNKPDKHTQSATEAARKEIPNAQVRNVKVAGGFAIATVSDPGAEGQIRVGSMTIFKVNEDESMTQLAIGSYFTPHNLLELGISPTVQAELTETSLDQVMQNLTDECRYNGGAAPGYIGFDGSFNPDGWQIDSGTLGNVRQALTVAIRDKNIQADASKKIVCVMATKNNSNATTDMKTYISTFTLELQFIAGGGEVGTHTFTFSIGPNHYQNYALDGKKLTYVSE